MLECIWFQTKEVQWDLRPRHLFNFTKIEFIFAFYNQASNKTRDSLLMNIIYWLIWLCFTKEVIRLLLLIILQKCVVSPVNQLVEATGLSSQTTEILL